MERRGALTVGSRWLAALAEIFDPSQANEDER